MVNQFREMIKQKVNPPKIVNEFLPVQEVEMSHRGVRQEPEWVPERKQARTRDRAASFMGNKLFHQLSSLVLLYKPVK